MSNEMTGANKKQIKLLQKIANQVLIKEEIYAKLTDSELQAQTDILKQRLAKGETLDNILPDAYAVCREAAWRVIKLKHYPVQVLGGVALHQGRICQMATGEGKTLAATLPSYLNALTGKGVHIVTVNDYLAKRDAEWMGKIHRFLGLSVGVVYAHQGAQEKISAYQSDITYGTNNEFGFDYLRDNMAMTASARVQRPLNYVIIDEVDSILIDEARTPLIIAGPSGKSPAGYIDANKFVLTLKKELHYEVDEKERQVHLTEAGIIKAQEHYKIDNLGDIENTEINYYINCSLKAHALFRLGDNYVKEKGEIIIVDEFTGRKMLGRRYSEGIHQAIEAKEKVIVREENRTLATITLQNYFRLYNKMSGMTGTAKTEEEEFNDIYGLDVVVIPTNLPNARKDYPDIIFNSRLGKLTKAVEEIEERHKTGQPLLIGTATVEKSEELSAKLNAKRIRHNVLNAKNHLKEAEIVAQAGKLGAVTIATNMAGRGTDILLGGNPEFMAKSEMLRQGYSHEDIEDSVSFIEGDSRVEQLKAVYQGLYKKYKVETDAEKEQVIAVGGLHIIGTERHESRRIDNQLRGRAARQGDVGSSVFYISTQDEMMRIFGGERMERILTMLRTPPDMPIQMKILSNQLESAQKKVESRNFSIRKNVLKFDDVNNVQRNTIYGIRNKILDDSDIHEEVLSMAESYARNALKEATSSNENIKTWDLDAVNTTLNNRYFPLYPSLVTTEMQRKGTARNVLALLTEKTKEMLENKKNELGKVMQDDFLGYEKYVLLRVITSKWMDHLDAMDQMRKGVGLQAIGQHDPIAIYKKEGFEMFEQLLDDIHTTTVRMLLSAEISQKIQTVTRAQPKPTELKEGEVLSLNAPCWCGSGKKYKHCHGVEQAKQAKEDYHKNKGKK